MPDILQIWGFKFNNIFTKPLLSEHQAWKDDVTPNMVKAYIEMIIKAKDAQFKKELRQIKREILEANDVVITDGHVRSTMYDRFMHLFSLYGV